MDYHVDLGIFRGPLDLLLHLVKRHEVEITDIPIAVIAEQYLRHLEVLRTINVEAVGEFLVMASTLMEIKSKMLLPRSVSAEAEQAEDPRGELVRQLVAYRQFRDAAERLEQLALQQASRLPRQQFEKPAPLLDPRQQPIQQVELWDLVSAFDRLLRATLTATSEALVNDETSQQDYMEEILARLSETAEERVAFNELFAPPHTRLRLVGLFLALLELIKNRQIRAEQDAAFGPIWISRGLERASLPPATATMAPAATTDKSP